MKAPLLILRKWMYLFSTLLFWGITSTGVAQCGGPSFPASADILANVPEASGYNLVYGLPIPTANQAWASQADIPYSINNSVALGSTPFSRVAYYLKLESPSLGVQWVWVSMNTFSNDLGRISIPTGDILYQQQVTNMNVLNYAGVTRTGINGNIEFWSNCYNPDNSAGVPGASNTLSDFGDMPTTGSNCYGSFQVHDFTAMETLLAYNGWAFSGFTADDLGIGNCTFCNNPDWTLASNANYYTVKELYVFVNAPVYQPVCNSATLSLNANGNATLTPGMVSNATVGSCGVQNIQLSKSAFTCADRGSNSVTVTFTVNGNTSSCIASVMVQDNINPVVTAAGTGLTLNCSPSAADINAALGTATATDNCGTPSLSVNTSGVVVSGNNSTQTRTWIATDGSMNTASVSRTVTWPTVCLTNTNHIFASSVTCSTFNNGSQPLLNVCYRAENGRVKKVSPKSFYYYTKVIAPATLAAGNTFYVDILQTKICAGFKLYEIQGNQVKAYRNNCVELSNGTEVSLGQGRVRITGAVPGNTYTISVRYKTKSLEGSTYAGNVAPICQNDFVTKISLGAFGTGTVVPGSQATILARPNCYTNGDDEGEDEHDEHDRSILKKEITSVFAVDRLTVVASPNPSSSNFILAINSNENSPLTVRIVNALGKTVYTQNNVTPKGSLNIGNNWLAGSYYAEIVQGKQKTMIKLVKQ